MAVRGSIRLHLLYGVALGLVFGFAASGDAAPYTYTKLVDTSGPFLRFGSASINDTGTVAFSAALDAGASGIFVTDGTTTTTVADTSGPFDLFGPPSFQDGGTVAFWARLDAGGNGIFTNDGTTTTTVADASGPFSSFDSPFTKNGRVAFWASFDAGGSGIFTSDGASTTTVGTTSGVFSSLSFPSLNSEGTVAFRATLDSGGSGIFIGTGGPVTTIIDDSGTFSGFSFPAINDGGLVVFWANRDAGGSGIFTSNGTTTSTVADTGGPFTFFSVPSINDAGAVAFQGFFSGGNGIFTGPDPVAHKMIAVGDPLSGSTVEGLVFSREGLNDAGQIAFIASLADGSQGVYRADPEAGGDPVPPPESVPPGPVPSPDPVSSEIQVSIDIKPGGNPNSINLGSRGVVPVAILSTATFEAATVDPGSVRFAGALVKEKRNGVLMASYEDVNGDGLLDLVIHMDTQALTLDVSSTEAYLEGETYDGTMITGSQSIRIVP